MPVREKQFSICHQPSISATDTNFINLHQITREYVQKTNSGQHSASFESYCSEIMYHEENYFLTHNKFLEDKLEYLILNIETRLDNLCRSEGYDESSSINQNLNKTTNGMKKDFLTFRTPYIRDFRNFSGPTNEDVRQIQQLIGTESIDILIKNKSWSKEAKQQLLDAVLDHYARIHLLKLIKQKNQLMELPSDQNNEDIVQKLRLIDEQTEQVKARKEPRIFVPENRVDSQIDWCAISAKLSTHHDAQDCRLMWSNNLHWSINDGMWTKEEDICLINAIAKHGKNDWDLVARELNSNRLAWQCCSRYNQEYAFVPMSIDEDDTDKIIEVINLCRIGNFVPWNQVMYFIQYHNLHQVKYQWQKYCSEKRGNVPWTHNEDLFLIRAVEKYGEKDWSRIAEYVPGRTNKSCRERYMMRLKFHRRSVGSWRCREDERLLKLIEQFGTNWSLISVHFPERNCHQLRNRYELLKNEARGRIAPIKHRKVYRNSSCQLVSSSSRRKRTQSELEINRKLYEIFSTYLSVNKNCSKSLVCRSSQDEVIYQSLARVLSDAFLERDRDRQLLDTIIHRAVSSKSGFLAPCIPTLRGYKAWTLQQDYLSQFCNQEGSSDCAEEIEVDEQILKVIVSTFLWPAVLSRLKRPDVDVSEYQVGSMIERDSKNLYKIRDFQKQITK